jgi:hypothetical protein
MNNHEIRNMEHGLALSRQFAKQQFQSTCAMVVSAALAFFITGVVAPGIEGLGLAIAAATGLSVGVWCQSNVYRGRNGSLTLAIVLIAWMWAVAVIVTLISLFG